MVLTKQEIVFEKTLDNLKVHIGNLILISICCYIGLISPHNYYMYYCQIDTWAYIFEEIKQIEEFFLTCSTNFYVYFYLQNTI